MFYIGIDDSGRGPVIGPMVLTGVLASEDQIEKLKALGVKDSKKISPKRRIFLEPKIKKIVAAYKIIKVEPSDIDAKITQRINLNKIEAQEAARIINTLTKKVTKKVEVIVDCPSPNARAWHNYLIKYVENPDKIELRCEHKADVNHIIVGAASILGKVTRDKEIEKIKKHYGIECGSGYPSDPICKKFLMTSDARKLAKAGLIRNSWATWKHEKDRKAQRKLDDF